MYYLFFNPDFIKQGIGSLQDFYDFTKCGPLSKWDPGASKCFDLEAGTAFNLGHFLVCSWSDLGLEQASLS